MSGTGVTLKGGDRMRKALEATVAQVGIGSVRVGFLEGATYPSGPSKGLSVAQVAFWNEFGTSRAPPRPFFRDMIQKHQGEWVDLLASALAAHGYKLPVALALLGTKIKDDLVASIVGWDSPPNAASTVARKGFDKPLIDTGVMQRAVDFEVTKGLK